MTIDVGQKAPNFTLKSHTGDMVSLEQFAGRPVVIVFFPLAFSSACTVEMTEFSNQLARFNEADAQVLGVSVDSPYALKAFAEKQGIEYPMLSDFNKEVSRDYGVLYEDLGGLRGVSKRSVFVIDADGVVQFRWVTEDPKVEPSYEEVMRFVDTMKSPARA